MQGSDVEPWLWGVAVALLVLLPLLLRCLVVNDPVPAVGALEDQVDGSFPGPHALCVGVVCEQGQHDGLLHHLDLVLVWPDPTLGEVGHDQGGQHVLSLAEVQVHALLTGGFLLVGPGEDFLVSESDLPTESRQGFGDTVAFVGQVAVHPTDVVEGQACVVAGAHGPVDVRRIDPVGGFGVGQPQVANLSGVDVGLVDLPWAELV